MTKKLVFRISIFVLLAIVLAFGINRYWNRYKLVHSPLYPMLQGNYALVPDLSSINRTYNISTLSGYMQIQHDRIKLPSLDNFDFKDNTDLYLIFGASVPYKNILKVISNNPDSISIDAPSHPLHGKYQVTFKECQSGSLGYTTTCFLCLDNDSTHLCLMRIK
jgi:hypothetical protein